MAGLLQQRSDQPSSPVGGAPSPRFSIHRRPRASANTPSPRGRGSYNSAPTTPPHRGRDALAPIFDPSQAAGLREHPIAPRAGLLQQRSDQPSSPVGGAPSPRLSIPRRPRAP